MAPKDFASDKKVEVLFLHKTADLVKRKLENSKVTSTSSEVSTCLAVMIFMRIHLRDVSGVDMSAK